MGQYYMPILGNETGEKWQVYDRSVDKKYTEAKLMEHSWWDNEFLKSFASKLYLKKKRVIWCGDYVTDTDLNFIKNNSSAKKTPRKENIWGGKVRKLGVKKKNFTLDNKFLVNHDTKEFIDLQEYKHISFTIYKNGYVDWINPIPLLTAIGNGRGNGDFNIYAKEGEDKVGIWAWNLISIEKEPPKNYKKINIRFTESGY